MGNSQSRIDARNAFAALLERTECPPLDDAIWGKIPLLPESREDVYMLIHPGHILKLRERCPSILMQLIRSLVASLDVCLKDTSRKNDFSIAINCIRFLTRIIPTALEEANDNFEDELFWTQDDTNSSPLAATLLNLLMDALFIPNFTIYEIEIASEDVDALQIEPHLMWTSVIQPTAIMDNNRTEVLRCLLACLSSPLFRYSDYIITHPNRWQLAICRWDTRHAQTLAFSLVNAIFSYDPIGWGIPYNSMLADSRQQVVDMSLHLLLVLLDTRYPEGSDAGQPRRQTADDDSATEDSDPNIYHQLLSRMQKPEYLSRLYEGFVRLLENPIHAKMTYLPGSMKSITCYQELLLLFWKLVEANSFFRNYCLSIRDITQILTPILYFLLEARQDPSKIGLISVCNFILVLLSSEREFGVQLNRPVTQKLPLDLISVSGTYADLLLLTVHRLVVSGPEKMEMLYDTLFTIICNASPYMKSINITSSIKLLNLLEIFASPRLMLANAHNHVYVALLLEVISNIIQHQFQGNPYLAYAILRRKVLFDKLSAINGSQLIARLNAAKSKKKSVSDDKSVVNASDSSIASTPLVSETVSSSDQSQEQKNEAHINDSNEARPEKAASCSGSSDPRPGTVAARLLTNSSSTEGFVPTPEWIDAWAKTLPLKTILALIRVLFPKVEQLSQDGEASSEEELVAYIRESTMVGLLPLGHAILVRRYVPTDTTTHWFTKFIWGLAYTRNRDPLPLFDPSAIKLFVQ